MLLCLLVCFFICLLLFFLFVCFFFCFFVSFCGCFFFCCFFLQSPSVAQIDLTMTCIDISGSFREKETVFGLFKKSVTKERDDLVKQNTNFQLRNGSLSSVARGPGLGPTE